MVRVSKNIPGTLNQDKDFTIPSNVVVAVISKTIETELITLVVNLKTRYNPSRVM